MNSFQIKNAEGAAISIGELDKEAAEFWGKEPDDKYYTSPAKKREDETDFAFMGREMSANWFDQLGWKIANQGNYYTLNTWRNVIHGMLDMNDYLMEDKKEGDIKLCEFKFLSEKDDNGDVTAEMTMRLAVGIYVKLEYAKPYVDLANYWQSKGYTPVQLKDY